MLPLFFLAASTIGVVWVQVVKTNLRIVSAEAAFQAGQADTSVSEVESFAAQQVEERLGLQLSKLEIYLGQGLAELELGVEPLAIVWFDSTILGELDQELKLELAANQLARASVLGKTDPLLRTLKNDYQLNEVTITEIPCSPELLCIEVVADSRRSLGVSLRNGQ